MESVKGKCFIVGAGSGDVGLCTIRAKECLATADVVVYDALANEELLDFAPVTAERIFVGKRAGNHAAEQVAIEELLIKNVRAGKKVVRLKGGDPFVFGRGGEEALALEAAGCEFEIVPGVTSAFAAPAYAGIPVTHRGVSAGVTLFSGHGTALDYAALAAAPGTKVMLMGAAQLSEHCTALLAAGMPTATPVAAIRNGTLPSQSVTIGTLAAPPQTASPAIVVFGEVVNLRKTLAWLELRPLFGKRIAVTRNEGTQGSLIQKLRELGADAFALPTIRIEPAPKKREFYELVLDAHKYRWIIFTSPNGVEAFFHAFYEIYKDAREIGAARIAAIGQATAARVRDFHLAVDLVPEKALAEELVKALKKEHEIENETFLVVQAEGARDVIVAEINRLGGIADRAIAYRTVPETNGTGINRFLSEGADIVTFTSASTAENFAALKLLCPPNTKTASIGPITSATLRKLGMAVDIEARTHDLDGLVKAILKA